jgi:23S rRNA pseudouridine2605 synthase
MKVRIQKLLATVGIDSRRHIEEMVLAGRVAVNGKKVRTLPVMVNEEADTIDVDGVEVYAPRKIRRHEAKAPDAMVYVVMNKPEKVYCTNVSQGEQLRAIDLLPPGFSTRVYPVGRLDAESRGLLLLTNDGELTNKLTHPKFGVSKVYRAIVDGSVSPELIPQMLKGIWLADSGGASVKAKASRVEIVKRTRERSTIDITLSEGRNRQIRRMLAKIGHKVRTLTRIKFGPLDLNKLELKPGESRLLTPREVTALKRVAEKGKSNDQDPVTNKGPRTNVQRSPTRD